MDLQRWLGAAVDEITKWQDEFGPHERHPAA